MDKNIETIVFKDFPQLLTQITDPPKKLRIQGEFPLGEDLKYLAVVGSRKYSEYGRAVTEELIKGLSGFPVCIISGLALGIDSIAHRSALKAGLKTVAVPGSGLADKVLYPKTHLGLRDEILENGGCLLSEFEDNLIAAPWTFPSRNRIMAGLSHAVLVIEAELQSGTLITSKFAVEYNRDVFTVPHNIFSKTSEGPHMLLRLGATPITNSKDILTALGIDSTKKDLFSKKDYSDCSSDEMEVLEILREPKSKDEIIKLLDKPVHITQTILSIMEIKGLIKEQMGELYLV